MAILSHHSIPPFNGEDFTYWKNIMQMHLMALGLDVWIFVERVTKF